MASKITLAQLERHGACSEYRGRFEETFGDSAKVTLELAAEYADRFDWSWAAEMLLTPANYAAWRDTVNQPEVAKAHRQAIDEAYHVREAAYAEATQAYEAVLANLPAHTWGQDEAPERTAVREAAHAVLRAAEDKAYQAYTDTRDKANKVYQTSVATKFAELYLTQPAVPERDEYLGKLSALDSYELADMLDVSSPDNSCSPGAEFLSGIRDDVHERLRNGATADDLRNESGAIASEFVEIIESRGTHRKWTAFVDLGAWQEDLSELGSFEDAGDVANRALWQIADRFCHKVARELDELDTEEDDIAPEVQEQNKLEEYDTCDNCGVHGVFDDEDTCENCGHVR